MEEKYGGVVIPTGPTLEIDRWRTWCAINEIEKEYGEIQNYNGLWVIEGTLGNQVYETSQRERIRQRLLKEGVDESRIRINEGEDTIDKVRHIIKLSETESNLNNFGISTYQLHFMRFQLALHFAKKENLVKNDLEFRLILSQTPDERWYKDLAYGLSGPVSDTVRLGLKGFSGATPDYNPLKRVYGKIKTWASRDNEDSKVPLE
ncbi:MAG: hypothetical protein ABIH49_00700 [archaeon]